MSLIDYLDRTSEYWDGLTKRLGFDPREGQCLLVHAAGVSFRQESLEDAKKLCTFDHSPPMVLEPEINNPYDQRIERDDGTAVGGAVKINIGVESDGLTGEFTMEHVGYLPKNYCPDCATSLSGKQALRTMCNKCDGENLMDIKEMIITRLLAGETFQCGVDTITEAAGGIGNKGLDIWLKLS